MRIRGRHYRTIWELPDATGVEVIDQRHLPHRLATATLRTPEEVAVAIREMWVRGAPLIGAAAGYGVYLAARWIGSRGAARGSITSYADGTLVTTAPSGTVSVAQPAGDASSELRVRERRLRDVQPRTEEGPEQVPAHPDRHA